MAAPHAPTDQRAPLGFVRSRDDRVVAGVAGGLGAQLGVEPAVLRFVLIALGLAGGAGVLLYLVAWGLSPEGDVAADDRPTDTQRLLALGAIVLGALLLLRNLGVWFGDGFVWPIVIAAAGSAVIWSRGTEDDRRRWSRLAGRLPGDPVGALVAGRTSPWRVLLGVVLVSIGIAVFLAANDAFAALRDVGLAVAATLAGATLILGPWVSRLVSQLGHERRERIRQAERAELAAHLHDSVLQTLALIQRAGDDPRRMVALARRQERELRAWLYARTTDGDSLRGVVDDLIEEIEAVHAVTIEPVVVGDAPVDDRVTATLAAAREALTNAAKHAGVDRVDLYLEASTDHVVVFVRDRGRGFDPQTVDDDRRGIRESIHGRMRRHGGTATITTAPGEGTEVELAMPLAGSDT
ncbi:MAG: PspC domain-containing protein [Nitriliruptorales bacterium]|nr:PspC domain-containing protein [Nitriliruptorales bacterium]